MLLPILARLSFALAFALGLTACISAPQQRRSVTVNAVQRLRVPLTFADVERTFGPATQGHGPYRWYPCADRKNAELWFWYQPPKSHREAKSFADSGVFYVTLVPAENPDKQMFLWPLTATHLDANAVLHRLYQNVQ